MLSSTGFTVASWFLPNILFMRCSRYPLLLTQCASQRAVVTSAGQWLRILNFLNATHMFKTPCTISRLPSTCLPNSLA